MWDEKLINGPPCSTNLLLILFLMQTSKKIPFDDPLVLNGIRGAYVLSNLIIMGVYLYVQQQISKKKGSFIVAFISSTTAVFCSRLQI